MVIVGSHIKDAGAVVHRDGVDFCVWAPFAKAAAVTGSFNNWTHTPMASQGGGYWAVTVAHAEAGQEYKFVLNDGRQDYFRNDPRSKQLTISAGNSVIADKEFDWGEDHFEPVPHNEQVIYELHIGTFSRADASTIGTFRDAMEKLDYLAGLGINMIELMPVSSMSMDRGWGYATDYIYAVESLYGGRHQMLEFVKAAHARGIGVILDVVYNHFGPDASLDLWQFDGWSQDGKGGIYFYNDWRSATPWGDTRPDFGRTEVRQYITDNVRMWLREFRLEGLRVDSTIYIRNAKGQNNDPANDLADGWRLLQEITAAAKKIKPSAITIAEDVSGNVYITKPARDGGAGFDAQWELTFPYALRQVLGPADDADRKLGGLCQELTKSYNGEPFQRVVFSDSHDSAANGAARLNEEISPGNAASLYARKRSLIASAVILTAPGIPMLLQGQEFMQGGSFTDWDELDWDNAGKYSGIVLAHQHLIALRRNAYGNSAGLQGGGINVIHFNDDAKVVAYHRWNKGGAGDDTMVIINFANKLQTGYGLGFPSDGLWRVRFNSSWKGYSKDFKEVATTDTEVKNSNGALDLGPYAVVILSQDKSLN